MVGETNRQRGSCDARGNCLRLGSCTVLPVSDHERDVVWKVEAPGPWPDPPPEIKKEIRMFTARILDPIELANGFNEWMRRYTENPEGFAREFQNVNQFLSEKNAGTEPTYGESCSQYLLQLLDELKTPMAAVGA
jgi:hypothetical protein